MAPYQTVWLLGEPGLRLWSATTDIRAFVLIDLLSDVGLGVLSLTLIERLSKHTRAHRVRSPSRRRHGWPSDRDSRRGSPAGVDSRESGPTSG
jgi:bacteriorhodopsin